MTSKRNGLRKTTSLYDAFDATDSTAGARYSQGHTSSVSPDMGFTSAKGIFTKASFSLHEIVFCFSFLFGFSSSPCEVFAHLLMLNVVVRA